ncbi:hypothetical protein MTO96_023413 [Rhipicephalus appendiculatus]
MYSSDDDRVLDKWNGRRDLAACGYSPPPPHLARLRYSCTAKTVEQRTVPYVPGISETMACVMYLYGVRAARVPSRKPMIARRTHVNGSTVARWPTLAAVDVEGRHFPLRSSAFSSRAVTSVALLFRTHQPGSRDQRSPGAAVRPWPPFLLPAATSLPQAVPFTRGPPRVNSCRRVRGMLNGS